MGWRSVPGIGFDGTDSGIGMRDWIWSVWGVVVAGVLASSWFREPRDSGGVRLARVVGERRSGRYLWPVRRLAVEIGFGPASELWPVWRLAGHGLGTAGFRRFRIDTDCVRCRTACFRGLIRESDIEIGFNPCMAAQSAVFLIDRIPKALGFRRSRMDTDCVRLPDCLFWWTDSGIGPRNRIQYEGNTGISVCPAVRPAGHHQRTTVFHRFWMDTGGDCLPQLPLSRGPVRRSGLEIGFGPCGMLVTGDVMTYIGFGNRGISPFLD